jgi:hypothetical protein
VRTILPSHDDVHHVGLDVVQQALVMGDEQDGHSGVFLGEGVHPVRHHLEGVDVEPRIGLVHDGQGRPKHGHLEDLVPLLLPSAESVVHGPLGEGGIHVQEPHPVQELVLEIEEVQLLTLRHMGLLGRSEEVGDGDAGDLHGILEGKKDSGLGALVGLHPEDILAFEERCSPPSPRTRGGRR